MSKRQRSTSNVVLCDNEEPISSALDEVRNRIRERAFQISLNGNHAGREMDDWLSAESEVMISPPVEIAEKDDLLVVTLPAAGIDKKDLKVFATRDRILVKADLRHDHEPEAQIHICEFRSKTLFRPIRLPIAIDLGTISTQIDEGMLRITARREGKTEAPKPRRVRPAASARAKP